MAAPYPASAVLVNPAWDALGTIQQLAAGSDVWPMTWSADGKQYAAYGDGWGFNAAEATKLSMGFAAIDAGPEGLAESDPGGAGDCQNINSNGETLGDGQAGKKPSGIIAIGTYLWLWVRNANGAGDNVELWYSTNGGVDWADCGWDMALSTMCFVNRGQGNANMAGGYIYAACANTSDAYAAADSMVLLRCAVTGNGPEMATQANWEYFSGTDGAPAWSNVFANRTPVFAYAGKCYRQQMSYCAAVAKYIWWINHDPSGGSHADGEWGVYEAADPYGPWKKVIHYETGAYWDMYPGETGNFPCKWMSLEGTTLTLYLVCSSGDQFTARSLTMDYDSDGGATMSELSRTGANSASAASGTAISVTHGLTINAGDLVLALVFVNGDRTVADNNGATPLAEKSRASGLSSTRYVFWRVAGSGEPASYAWTLSGSDRWCVVVLVYAPAAGQAIAADPFDVSPGALNNATSATITATGISIGVSGATALAVGYIDSASVDFSAYPADGYATAHTNNGSQPVSVSDKTVSGTPPIAQGQVTWTATTSTQVSGEQWSLKPGSAESLTLVVADLVSASTLDGLTVAQKHALTIADMLSSGAIDVPAMVQKHLLAVDDLTSAAEIGHIVFSIATLLSIADLVSSSSLDAAPLTQKHSLAAADLVSVSEIDGATLAQKHSLTIDDLASAGVLDGLAVTQKHLLVIADALSACGIDHINFVLPRGIVTASFALRTPGITFTVRRPGIAIGARMPGIEITKR